MGSGSYKSRSPIKAKRFIFPLPKKSSVETLSSLPTEIAILILSNLSTKDLTSMRVSCKKFKHVSNSVLRKRVKTSIVALEPQFNETKGDFQECETTQKPIMKHYRGFLKNLNASIISESIWYTNPPQEFKTVCACLCLLRGGKAGDDLESWTGIKRAMSRYDFKTWFSQLGSEVELLKTDNVKRVERIIMVDPAVTYERLRDVSVAGYKLLIIVAASLQFSGSFTLMDNSKLAHDSVKSRMYNLKTFQSCL